MKYVQYICPGPDENRSLRSDGARWLTDAHIEHGVRRGRNLHGRAVRQGFLRLYRAARDIAQLMAVWRDRVCMRRHLSRMDNHLLDDIGLSRLDAKREINKPFWRE